MYVNIFTVFCMLFGLLFLLGTSVGLLRFPDLFTRIHAASKGDTLSSTLLLLGCAAYQLQDISALNTLVCIKILFITGFIFLTSPTAGHALLNAAYHAGARPWTKDSKKGKSK